MTLFSKQQLAAIADHLVNKADDLKAQQPDDDTAELVPDREIGLVIGHADRQVAKGMSRFSRPQ